MNRVVRVLVVLLIGLHSCSAAVAQSNDPLVLNVTVTNKKGTVIRGLTLENFSVTVDNQPQKVLSLNEREVPASIGILIDTSGSQHFGNANDAAQIREQFKQGLERFFKMSNPGNEYFALAFNTKFDLMQDWTSDYRPIVEKLDSLTYKKQTSLYDALKLAVEKMKTSRNSKKVLILASDGSDNNSGTSFKKIRDLLKESDVVLYSVGLTFIEKIDNGVTVHDEGKSVLSELTSLSGGRVLFLNYGPDIKAFNDVFELIAMEVRTQYQLAIAPDFPGAKTGWRKLKIKASRSNPTEELVARTRQYYR